MAKSKGMSASADDDSEDEPAGLLATTPAVASKSNKKKQAPRAAGRLGVHPNSGVAKPGFVLNRAAQLEIAVRAQQQADAEAEGLVGDGCKL